MLILSLSQSLCPRILIFNTSITEYSTMLILSPSVTLSSYPHLQYYNNRILHDANTLSLSQSLCPRILIFNTTITEYSTMLLLSLSLSVSLSSYPHLQYYNNRI